MLDSRLDKNSQLSITLGCYTAYLNDFVRQDEIEIHINIRARTPGYESFTISETPSFSYSTVRITSFSNGLSQYVLVEIETSGNLSSSILSTKVFVQKIPLVNATIIPKSWEFIVSSACIRRVVPEEKVKFKLNGESSGRDLVFAVIVINTQSFADSIRKSISLLFSPFILLKVVFVSQEQKSVKHRFLKWEMSPFLRTKLFWRTTGLLSDAMSSLLTRNRAKYLKKYWTRSSYSTIAQEAFTLW